MKIAQLTGVISDEHHRGKLIKARVAACKQCGELSVPVLSGAATLKKDAHVKLVELMKP